MRSGAVGYFMALFTIMIWSLNVIYSRYLANYLTASEISFYRWLIALFVMLPVSARYIKHDWLELLKHWKMIVLMAVSGVGLQNWLIYRAGHTASATDMALIGILGPIILVVISRQKINLRQLSGLILAVLGVLTVILHGNLSNILAFNFVYGDLYMLGSAFLFAVYSLIQKQAPNNVHPSAMLTCAIIVSVLMFLFPALPVIWDNSFRSVPFMAWVILLVLGLFNSALAYLSWDIAIKRIGIINTGTLYYTMPIFSIAAAHFLLGEKVFASQIIGAICIISGALLVVERKLKR